MNNLISSALVLSRELPSSLPPLFEALFSRGGLSPKVSVVSVDPADFFTTRIGIGGKIFSFFAQLYIFKPDM